ncbi:MAG: phosphomannomutase CpsG, partial [Pseudomonadota bacterium]|nr:phosphomannomutase CpsG [Pseudomonadota bacterium]
MTTETVFEPIKIDCFKAYDVRGELGKTLDEAIAYRIGRAFVEFLDARKVVIGGDIRLSTEGIKQATIEGITDAGADVID